MKNKGIQTLHCHTTASDGKLTHLEVLNACKKYGISVVAFTDHDAVPNKEVLKVLQRNRDRETKWVMGIEISSGLPKELGGGVVSSFHIVGLFIDPTNSSLLDYCAKSQETRVERMKKMVKNMQGLGFDITEKMCLKASKGETLGRPHIVDALKTREKNLEIIEELRRKMEKEAEKDPKIKKEYSQMMEEGERQYPYVLFLKEAAYIPEIFVPREFWVDLDESVSLIRNAGGLAIVAHYTFAKRAVPPDILEKLFKEDRVDGGETVYGLEETEIKLGKEVRKDEKFVAMLVKKYNKVASGGADAHNEGHLRLFAENSEYSKRTIGMVEKIIKKTGVDTKWSSLPPSVARI